MPEPFEAPGAPLGFSLARQSEGSGAPGGAACSLVRALLTKSAAPTGAPPKGLLLRLICGVFLRRRAPLSHRGLFTGRGVSQLLAGDHLVSPGGAPTPPGAQGRRSLETRAPHLTPSTDVTG